MSDNRLLGIYDLLFAHFGRQGWWPGESRFEIAIGAILTQNTNWGNVEKAIGNIKTAGLLVLKNCTIWKAAELAELIRPAGYFNVKAKRLKNFLNWLFDNYDGELAAVEKVNTDCLRAELLAIKGVGRETADSILLYAFEREIFVIDTYTARVATRHELIEAGAEYEQLQYLFESNLPGHVQLFNEYHALLVRVGKEFCRPKVKCQGCPLEKLPHCLDPDYM